MTEGKQGVSAWLRERAKKLRSAVGFSCKDFVSFEFGISSPCKSPRRCCDCYADMFERIADRIDAEMVEYERLKKENAELKAEIADWKGNAEGFQPDAYMKLPLDADGEPIRIGDEMNIDGDAMTVLGYRLYNGTLLLIVKKGESDLTYTPKPSEIRHFKPEPADSWEKLEKDAMGRACELAGSGHLRCGDCEWGKEGIGCQAMARLEILKRAKKLAGIDGRLRGSYGERVKRPVPKVLGADGAPINVGDTVWAIYDGRKHVVKAVCSDECTVEYEEGGWDYAKRVAHESPTPKVLDADGVEIKVGDVVYFVADKDESALIVECIDVSGEKPVVDLVYSDEIGTWHLVDPEKLTHERPDSWRLWGEDLDTAVKVGEVDKVEMMRRAKALAKAGEVE